MGYSIACGPEPGVLYPEWGAVVESKSTAAGPTCKDSTRSPHSTPFLSSPCGPLQRRAVGLLALHPCQQDVQRQRRGDTLRRYHGWLTQPDRVSMLAQRQLPLRQLHEAFQAQPQRPEFGRLKCLPGIVLFAQTQFFQLLPGLGCADLLQDHYGTLCLTCFRRHLDPLVSMGFTVHWGRIPVSATKTNRYPPAHLGLLTMVQHLQKTLRQTQRPQQSSPSATPQTYGSSGCGTPCCCVTAMGYRSRTVAGLQCRGVTHCLSGLCGILHLE